MKQYIQTFRQKMFRISKKKNWNNVFIYPVLAHNPNLCLNLALLQVSRTIQILNLQTLAFYNNQPFVHLFAFFCQKIHIWEEQYTVFDKVLLYYIRVHNLQAGLH